MKKYSSLLMIIAAMALSACGSDSASYMVGGKSDNAFSLFRNKAYPGADWELALALTHLPDCQRRIPLAPAASDKPYKAVLYLAAEGGYVLNSADTWYEVQIDKCTLQKAQSAPTTPGDLVGSWEERDGDLKFYPSTKQ